ncbi:MAG: RluA family pseudouridine synthase [Bacilli bacterium]
MKYEIIVDDKNLNVRVDKFLSTYFQDKISRNKIADSIDKGNLFINGKKEKTSYKLKLNDKIEFDYIEDSPYFCEGEDIPLDIVYEDEDIAIINKPQGLVVHPGAGNKNGTLANALVYYFNSLSDVNGEFRPGIVHRIDKDTSGLICIAKNNDAHLFLSEQLQTHKMNREYIALVQGVIKENNGKIDLPIARSKQDRNKMAVDKDGKTAITYFDVIKRFDGYTLIHLKLLTGRTHQIRVHLSYIGYPIEGDEIYNKKNKNHLYNKGQLLCATKLTLEHPRTHEMMSFEIELPSYFKEIIDIIK